MKALFLKEFRQGRPLLLFAAALAILIAIGRSLIARSNPFYFHNVEELNRGAGALLLCLPAVLALFAGSGLFSGEADRGTMPVLLSLPLSRRRIWVGKALAGLALALVASLLLLGLGAALMPRALNSASLWAYLPDLLLWTALAYGAALFTTVLVGNTTSSLGFALIVAGAFAGVAACLVHLLGAPLLWYADTLDMAIWGGVFAIPLVLASVAALTRGELLDSARKWRFAGRTLLLGVLASVFLVSGVARAGTRYQRSAVTALGWLAREDNGPIAVLPVVALGNPVRISRQAEIGWVPVVAEGQSQHVPPWFRRNYLVAVDIRTGKELLHVREPRPGYYLAACSRDGRYAAVIRLRQGLTWGAPMGDVEVLEIHDLRARRRLYVGTPAFLRDRVPSRTSLLSWSPDGKLLALGVVHSAFGSQVHLLRPDGSERGTLADDYQRVLWSPTGDALYGLDARDRVHRIETEDLSDRVLWTGTSRLKRIPSPLQSISPDGRWLVVQETRTLETKPHGVGTISTDEATLRVVPTEGGAAQKLWSRKWGYSEPRIGLQAVWSADGKTLYGITGEQFLSWHPGQAAFTPTGVTLPRDWMSLHQLLARPGTDQILVWLRQRKADTWPDSQEMVGGKALLVSADGKLRESPASALAKDHWPVGFTTDGKVILEGDSEIVTADLDTGEARRVYP